jgi:hypothetical protein
VRWSWRTCRPTGGQGKRTRRSWWLEGSEGGKRARGARTTTTFRETQSVQRSPPPPSVLAYCFGAELVYF